MSPRPAIDHIRKPQILEAAAAVITERGLSATRIADVAERAGTSPAAVIYWFGGREELLTEALIADEQRFAVELDERIAGDESASSRLLTILNASVEQADWSLWIELWSRSLHDPSAREARQRLDDLWRGKLAAVVAEGQAAGEFDSELDVAEVAATLAALVDGLGVQVTLGDELVTPERMLATSVAFAEAQLRVDLTPPAGVETAA
ncbi:MAG: TetR family transcriptional regulator C-terminal domain-containing protein [Actinomycetota bacterium]|nr:TetR family transcriptional regulator C-terminal domain-containing protein [Actinomycetota bacterium]